MDVFLGEWVNLLLRWAHMIVGIGWIGTSFYFVALDYSLNRKESSTPGVFGAAWQVAQTVQNKAMPLGNQTMMTDAEREKIGQWIRAQH